MNSSRLFISIIRNKPLAVVVFIIIGLCLLNSCAKEEEPVIEYKDKESVEELSLGWQERFDIENQVTTADSAEEQQKILMKGCEAELSHVEKYANEEFKKQGLKDLIVEYIASLKEGKDALQYYVKDNDKYLSLTISANNDRRRILTRLASDYGLSVDEKYKDAFAEWLTNAETSGTYSMQKEEVEDFVAEIEFEREPNEYYGEKYHTYSARVENTTNINFEKLDIKVKLYDEDGVVVDTEHAYVENFKSGSTEKIEFSSDAEFEKMEVSCDSWKEEK